MKLSYIIITAFFLSLMACGGQGSNKENGHGHEHSDEHGHDHGEHGNHGHEHNEYHSQEEFMVTDSIMNPQHEEHSHENHAEHEEHSHDDHDHEHLHNH